jgi:hypothetical protein
MPTISEAFAPFLKPILMMLDIFLLLRLERVVVAGSEGDGAYSAVGRARPYRRRTIRRLGSMDQRLPRREWKWSQRAYLSGRKL